MSQPNRSQRSRTNATQACTNCQIRHQRCEKLSEGDVNSTCTNCKTNHLHCENTPPKKRGRKPRPPGIIETPYSCGTVVSFIGQEQMPVDQITASINYHEPFFRTTEALINQEPTPITTSINTYEPTITNLGTSHTYNHIATIPSFRAIDAFTGQGQTQDDQNTAPIDPYENFFETTGTLIGHEQTSNYSIATLPFFRTSNTFIGQGQTLDEQNTTLINLYESFFGEFIGQESTQKHQDITPINTYEATSSNFGTSHGYNNITTFPSFGTIDVFTGQVQTLDDQNTALINSYESFFGATREFIGQEPTQNHQNITPINIYETTTSNLGTSHTYNHIATIPSFRAIDAFTGQGQTLDDQNTAPIDPYETFFETTGTLIGHEQISNHSHIYNHITALGTSDTLIGQGQTLDDQNATLINKSFFGE
ncbi:hypothetical protein F8M41_017348 [Gigaspora margarita]|uniref:Zn(2)-C6 fungal-type domain-containing protein n=1 Tax=Gigaspora margarita TaxID=4874 RepID=A0A8H4EM79_GIGMA|nr:hypothetical protein F8M41_017348 [Gigaspora margarita]